LATSRLTPCRIISQLLCSHALPEATHSSSWKSLGEQVIAAMTAQPAEEGAAFLAGAGMHPVIAERVAPGIDEVMGACILRLYRSAVQPVLAELGKRLEAAAARPGLAILATEDHGGGTDEPQPHRWPM
jgi:hypothetical protein